MHHDTPETKDYSPNAISINVFTLLRDQRYTFINRENVSDKI